MEKVSRAWSGELDEDVSSEEAEEPEPAVQTRTRSDTGALGVVAGAPSSHSVRNGLRIAMVSAAEEAMAAAQAAMDGSGSSDTSSDDGAGGAGRATVFSRPQGPPPLVGNGRSTPPPIPASAPAPLPMAVAVGQGEAGLPARPPVLAEWLTANGVSVGFGRIVALYGCSSTSYQIH